MKCNKFEKWIYLYKTGELNEDEQQALQEHLLSCSHCAQLANETHTLQYEVEKLQKQPVLHTPQELTANIMNHISYHQRKAVKRRAGKALRYSLQFAMLLIAVLFAAQEIDTRRRMLNLEQRIRTTQKPHMLTLANEWTEADNITINKTLLLELLNENKLLRMEFEKLRDELIKQGLEIDSTLLQNEKVKELISDPQLLKSIFEL